MNSIAKRVVVKEEIKFARGDFLFFQETEMEDIDYRVINSLYVFPNANFVFCPSRGLSRGILLVWNSDLWQQLDVHVVVVVFFFCFIKDAQRNVEWVASFIY